MTFGMLWKERDKDKPLEKIVREATQYYRDKYGWTATLCWVNPSQYPPETDMVGAIKIIRHKTIQKDTYWIGTDDPERK